MQLNKVGTVFDNARSLLNDQVGSLFTNTVLLPYFTMAYDEIRQECEDNNISITNKTTDAINLLAGVTDIGGPTGPALPADFVEPLAMWENPMAQNQDFVLMVRKRFLPKTNTITAYLSVYEYSDGYIKVLGATGNVLVKIDYVSIGMPNVVNNNTMLKIRNMILFLSYTTAAFASMFIGENETRAAALHDLAEPALERFLNIQIKNSQNIITRRKPFMSSYKMRRVGWSR